MKVFRKIIIFLAIVTLMLGTVTANAADISFEMQDKAEKLSTLGVFRGTGKGLELDRAPTRLEGLVMLIRLIGAENEALSMDKQECVFTDVPDWGKGYVNYAYKNGLTKGIGNNLFGSNDILQAESYLTFLLRALGYDDKAGDFEWSKAVKKAGDVGIIDTRFIIECAAGEKYTRGHIAVHSYNALQTYMKQSHSTLIGYLADKGVIDEETARKAGLGEYLNTDSASFAVGQYIEFGKYLGKPILWKIINIDDEGDPLLFSEKIISIKCFDAAESGTYDYDYTRDGVGSANWETSNIREWLNSDDAKVQYSTCPPVKEALGQTEGYADENGFLSNFSEKEKTMLKAVKHKMLLDEVDKAQKDGGTEDHIFDTSLSPDQPISEFVCTPQDALTNYDNSYYKMVTDKVFLLSVKELKEYVADRNDSWIKETTETAMEQATEDYCDFYWLRTPSDDTSVRVAGPYEVRGQGVLDYTAAFANGVCPAIYLDVDGEMKITSGNGSKEHPYVLRLND